MAIKGGAASLTYLPPSIQVNWEGKEMTGLSVRISWLDTPSVSCHLTFLAMADFTVTLSQLQRSWTHPSFLSFAPFPRLESILSVLLPTSCQAPEPAHPPLGFPALGSGDGHEASVPALPKTGAQLAKVSGASYALKLAVGCFSLLHGDHVFIGNGDGGYSQ
ncbi:hypothetical protein L345_07114, partial [Ophiophagus hannah]